MSQGRPRRISDAMIVQAGAEIGLSSLTIGAVAEALGVSEMTIYRRTGGSAGLRRFVAEGIIGAQDTLRPTADNAEEALIEMARALRAFVLDNPGIAAHLADLGADSPTTLTSIDESQRAFAEHFGWPPATASILVSVTAEHAIALAELNPTSHQRPRTPGRLPPEVETIRAGAEAAAGLNPAARFDWSMRATIRGAMSMLGVATSPTHQH